MQPQLALNLITTLELTSSFITDMMNKLSINFIGAGRLGKTIAKLICHNNLGTILGVCNSSWASSLQAVAFIGQGAPYQAVEYLPPARITFITVADDKIELVCKQLPKATSAQIALHCSGSLTSEILISAKQNGYAILSLHPLRSFANPELSTQEFAGTYCSIEGDQAAVLIIQALFSQMGGKIITITKDKKAIYHAAAVMATNYLVTLAQTAIVSIADSGINHEDSLDIIFNLMQGTLNNLINSRSPQQTLTGPIQRGDIQTIKSHLSAIENEATRKLYTGLGAATLNLTTHDQTSKELISQVLGNQLNLD